LGFTIPWTSPHGQGRHTNRPDCKEALGLLESLFFWLFSIRLIWADTADCGELALWL
jgi:hypothetical protein